MPPLLHSSTRSSDPEFLEYQKLKAAWWNHSTGIIILVIALAVLSGMALVSQPNGANIRPWIGGLVITIAAAVGAIRTKLRFLSLKKKFEP